MSNKKSTELITFEKQEENVSKVENPLNDFPTIIAQTIQFLINFAEDSA
jgi:hypothetical protein